MAHVRCSVCIYVADTATIWLFLEAIVVDASIFVVIVYADSLLLARGWVNTCRISCAELHFVPPAYDTMCYLKWLDEIRFRDICMNRSNHRAGKVFLPETDPHVWSLWSLFHTSGLARTEKECSNTMHGFRWWQDMPVSEYWTDPGYDGAFLWYWHFSIGSGELQ